MSQYERGATANVNVCDRMASTIETSSGPWVGRARTNIAPWPMNCSRATTARIRSNREAVMCLGSGRARGKRVLVRASAVDDRHRYTKQTQVDDEFAPMMVPVVQAHRPKQRRSRPRGDFA